MKISIGLLVIFQFICLLIYPSSACTVFTAAKDGKIFGAKNTDWDNIQTRLLFTPPSEGKYGRVHIGNEGTGGFINTAGMNDQGLWYASASVYDEGTFGVRSDVQNYFNKPHPPYELVEIAMETCATVDDVIDLFSMYYEPWGWTGHHLVADKLGNSVLIEFGEKDVVFLRNKDFYQVMTNFPNADTQNDRWYNCYRYNTASAMLKNSSDISIDLFRSICDAVHQEQTNSTVLSTVCDLKKGLIYIYNFSNFDEVVIFNLEEELNKGVSYYSIPEYFNQVKALSPKNGDHMDPASVTFTWNGNAHNYFLYCSSDPDFTDIEPVLVAQSPLAGTNNRQFVSLCVGLVFFVFLFRRRRAIKVVFACLVISSTLIFCEADILRSPYAPSQVENNKTLENLKTNTTYYWKILAIGKDGIDSESNTLKFRTTE